MIPLLLLGGLLAGAAVLAVTFWDEIKQFLKAAYERVKKVVSAAIVGVVTYVQTKNIYEGIKAAYKFYSKNERGQWQEHVVTKTLEASEVPEHIREKLERTNKPIDISKELELELS